jgi:hypothetical protein
MPVFIPGGGARSSVSSLACRSTTRWTLPDECCEWRHVTQVHAGDLADGLDE